MKRARGFTLVEVLVSLGIVAIALVAGLQASAALTNNAQRQSDVLLGHICAENVLVAIKLARQLPSVGDSDQACRQAGQDFVVHVHVAPTPNPNFRLVYAQVFTDPHLVAREMAVEVEHPTLGRMRSLGSAIKMSDTPTDPRRRAPMLGEHTEAVLEEYGFSADEIASLGAATRQS